MKKYTRNKKYYQYDIYISTIIINNTQENISVKKINTKLKKNFSSKVKI